MTPSKAMPMPMEATKKPTMRVAASIPLGPSRFCSRLPPARNS